MIIKAILKINPKAEVSISGNDINTLTWENGTAPIPKEQILAKIPEVELDMALANLRQKRNKLLADTDYLVLPDSTLTPQKKSEWMTYRTNLRNLTQGLTTVEQINNVAYPVKPQK